MSQEHRFTEIQDDFLGKKIKRMLVRRGLKLVEDEMIYQYGSCHSPLCLVVIAKPIQPFKAECFNGKSPKEDCGAMNCEAHYREDGFIVTENNVYYLDDFDDNEWKVREHIVAGNAMPVIGKAV